MMQGRGGMGSHKHRISGRSGKSPKFRHAMKREAELNERKKRSLKLTYENVRDIPKP